jgi:hypothetical protein
MSELAPTAHPDQGHVYILTNEAMPGFVKIGLTRGDDVTARLKQLDTTSVPLPFECLYSALVPDCRKIERTLHFVFGEKRVRTGREFFRVDPDLVRAILELVAIRKHEPTEVEQGLTPAERSAITEEKTERAKPLSMANLGIPIGATLEFSKDPDITCVVASARTVRFRDMEVSLSAAALMVVHEMGYNWSTVRGSEYWTYQNSKLSALVPALPADDAPGALV